jgi:hypothetical protein
MHILEEVLQFGAVAPRLGYSVFGIMRDPVAHVTSIITYYSFLLSSNVTFIE